MLMTLRLCVTCLLASCPLSAHADQYKLAASSADSIYHATGVALEAAASLYLAPSTGIGLSSFSTRDARDNLEMLASKDADFAILPSLLGHQARTGTGSPSDLGPQQDLRAVATLLPIVYHAVLRRSKQQAEGMDGLLAFAESGLGLEAGTSEAIDVTRFLFQNIGAGAEAISRLPIGKTPAVDARKDDHVDALITTGHAPMPEIMDLLDETNGDMALLSLPGVQRQLAGDGYDLLTPATIRAGTYPHQRSDIETVALPIFLATRADVDERVVYEITKTTFEHVEFLRTIDPALSALDFDDATDHLPTPLHAGAARYYREYGLSTSKTLTTSPDYPVYTLDAEDPQQRRIDANRNVLGVMVDPDRTSLKAANDLALLINTPPTDIRVVVQRGEGAGRTVNDLLYMKGVDLGIVQADVLDHLRRQEGADWLPRQIHYLARLYDHEVHILAGSGIRDLRDLTGRAVNFGPSGSASEVTAAAIFSHYGIAADQRREPAEFALEKLYRGDIDAVVICGGKPISSLERIEPSSGLKLLPIPHLSHGDLYQRASLTSEDYPTLIPNGEDVRTISVPTILTTYKWPENSDRYRLLSSFYSTLKARLNQLQSSSYVHPKWRDVSLSAPFKGWPRSSIVLDDASAALTPPAYPAAAERPAPGNG